MHSPLPVWANASCISFKHSSMLEKSTVSIRNDRTGFEMNRLGYKTNAGVCLL